MLFRFAKKRKLNDRVSDKADVYERVDNIVVRTLAEPRKLTFLHNYCVVNEANNFISYEVSNHTMKKIK